MKCPLFMAMQLALADRICPLEAICLEEQCAWWHKATARCYLATISVDLDRVVEAIQTLARPTGLRGK